ncbi:hypothetical protein CANINC_003566 [Pichia inconspicua]|uniref:Uncharacterized protein n=1 Tax=Pichia inconspicua TaxID=52247 RepID=A0A4V4NFE4_9ASCO|nr:hypothetical protein CANINC_003566 [[Candida] inconspicua]
MSKDFKPFLKTISIKDGNNRIPIIVGRASLKKGRETTDPHNVYLNEPHISAKHFSFDDGKIINYSNNTTLYMENVLHSPKIVTKEITVNKKCQLICIGFRLNEFDIQSMSPEKVIESSRVVLVFHQVAPWRYKVYCSKSDDFIKQFNTFFQQKLDMWHLDYFEYTVFLKYLFHMATVIKEEENNNEKYISEDDADYIFSDSNDETESSLDLSEDEDDEYIGLKLLDDIRDIVYDDSDDSDSDYEVESVNYDDEHKDSTSLGFGLEVDEYDMIGEYAEDALSDEDIEVELGEEEEEEEEEEGEGEREEAEEEEEDEEEEEEEEEEEKISLDEEVVKGEKQKYTDNGDTGSLFRVNESKEASHDSITKDTQSAENSCHRRKRSFDEMNTCITNLSDVIIDQQRIIKRQESEIIQLKRSKHIKKVMLGFLSGAVATIGALIEYGKHKEC